MMMMKKDQAIAESNFHESLSLFNRKPYLTSVETALFTSDY